MANCTCYTVMNANQCHTCVLTGLVIAVFVSVSHRPLSAPCAESRHFGPIQKASVTSVANPAQVMHQLSSTNFTVSIRVAGTARQARSGSKTTATTRPHRQSYSANIHSVCKAIMYIVFHACDVQDTSRDPSARSCKRSFARSSYRIV